MCIAISHVLFNRTVNLRVVCSVLVLVRILDASVEGIKGKAIPLQACTGLEVSGRLKLSDFNVVSLSALCTGRLAPQEIFLVLVFVRG
jgi:hypothetical protein